MEILTEIENQILTNLNLMDVAEGYCKALCEDSKSLSAIMSVLNIMRERQKLALDMLDKLYESSL